MNTVEITFEDGSKKSYPKFCTYYEIYKDFNVNNDIIGMRVNENVISLYDRCKNDSKVEFLYVTNASGNRIYSNGIKMLFEYAVSKVMPDSKVIFSAALPKGIIAKITNTDMISSSELLNIENLMRLTVRKNLNFERLVVSSEESTKYYDEINENIKSYNIHITDLSLVYLYRLENFINYYYYEMPYSTGVLEKFEIHTIKDNLVYINYPSEFDNGEIVKCYDYDVMLNNYYKNEEIQKNMLLEYIRDVNDYVSSGNIKNLIRRCELSFNIGVNSAVKEILKQKDVKFVMLSGPSSSGKTTTAERLTHYFDIYGKVAYVVSLDDYFKEREDSPRDANGEFNFEGIDALDIDYLGNDINKMLNGEEVILPRFNFVTGKKELSNKKVKLNDDTIIIFEGLHAINDALTPTLNKKYKYKIFVSPLMPLRLDEQNFIAIDDLRLIRRLLRDYRVRGYSVSETLHKNFKVRKGENTNINPFIKDADIIINTSLPYELGVLKVFAEPLLRNISSNDKYYKESRRLLDFLKQYYTISPEFVPQDSIIREFIGGINND